MGNRNLGCALALPQSGCRQKTSAPHLGGLLSSELSWLHAWRFREGWIMMNVAGLAFRRGSRARTGIPTVAVRGEGQQRPRCVDRGPGVELSFIAESLNRY